MLTLHWHYVELESIILATEKLVVVVVEQFCPTSLLWSHREILPTLLPMVTDGTPLSDFVHNNERRSAKHDRFLSDRREKNWL